MSFETWYDEDDHDTYNYPDEAMKEAFEAGKKEALAEQSSEKISVTDFLPCPVKLPPSLTIAKGCKVGTLLEAINARTTGDFKFADGV